MVHHDQRRHLKAILLIFSLFFQTHAWAQYTDPLFQTDLFFGLHSQWVQPWRGYLETVPASWFLNGTGVVLNSPNPDLVCQMLARHGIALTRIEIGWGNVRLDGSITNPAAIAALQACKNNGLRPIILLNANQGVPCPLTGFTASVAADAPAGATTLTLTDTTGFVPGKTGLSNLTTYKAAEVLVTAVNGNTVSLSKPLPKALAAGTSLAMATLKYRPFSVPGSADYNATLAGWQAYVQTVGQLATQYLGPGGYDLEVWNELTFGSDFLSINDYYDPPFAPYDEQAIWGALVKATADVANANPALFAGVEISDGFANTIPWPASSTEPDRVTGISKHPYPRYGVFPGAEQGDNGELNALLGQENPPHFVPGYTEFFPEVQGTGIRTEFILRDLSPITTDIYGTLHGRFARGIDKPCWGWITECGYTPSTLGISDAATAQLLKAKSTARFFTFFLHKGCKKVTLFATGGGDTGLGLVEDNFLAYAAANTVYPTNDTGYTSPALAVTARITAQMANGASPTPFTLRPLTVTNITDTHNHFQFAGDGTPAHPNLYDREVLTVLPFQSNPHRFVIAYYVMTRLLAPPLSPEEFDLSLEGINPTSATCYDPLTDASLPVTIAAAPQGGITLSIQATDYPLLLILDENPNPSPTPSATPTPTPTPTPSPSPSATPTSTPTPTPSPSPSATPTSTPTPTPSPSPSATPTSTPTPNPSPSPFHRPRHWH